MFDKEELAPLLLLLLLLLMSVELTGGPFVLGAVPPVVVALMGFVFVLV